MAYVSKQLNFVVAGWPNCLRTIAATALLVKGANKWALEQPLAISVYHAIEGVLKRPPDRWVSENYAQLMHHQSLLLKHPQALFARRSPLNPATLLPNPDLDNPSTDDCLEILQHVRGTLSGLTDHL